jgi:hypothetical protein
MWEYLQTPAARLVIWSAVLATVIAVSVYIVAKVREGLMGRDSDANELLTKFREIRSQGDLSEEEFRTIKTQLAQQLQKESGSYDDRDRDNWQGGSAEVN